MLIVNLSYHKIFRNAATVMLSGQVADGVTTIFAGELVCHSNKIYVYNWLHLSKKKKIGCCIISNLETVMFHFFHGFLLLFDAMFCFTFPNMLNLGIEIVDCCSYDMIKIY